MNLLFTKCAQLFTVLDKSRRCHHAIPIGVKNDNNFAAVGAGHARDQKTRGHGPLLQLFVRTLPFIFPCATLNAAPPAEYEVKAAFIHNIAKFVEWPAAKKTSGAWKLCILGRDASGGAFDLLQGKAIDGGYWEVSQVDPQTNLRWCQVLFITAAENVDVGKALDAVEGSAVLTISDTEGYAGQGVIINFYLEQNKVRFEINVDAARRAGVRISPQLLRLARIARDEGEMR